MRPTLTPDAAEAELRRLLVFGAVEPEQPAWAGNTPKSRADAWLVVADSFALPLSRRGARYLALSCIARCQFGTEIHERRIARQKARKHRRLRRNEQKGKLNRRREAA